MCWDVRQDTSLTNTDYTLLITLLSFYGGAVIDTLSSFLIGHATELRRVM